MEGVGHTANLQAGMAHWIPYETEVSSLNNFVVGGGGAGNKEGWGDCHDFAIRQINPSTPKFRIINFGAKYEFIHHLVQLTF